MSDQQLSRRHSPDPGVFQQVLGGVGYCMFGGSGGGQCRSYYMLKRRKTREKKQ